MTAVLRGATLGAVPGLVLVGASLPVSGEAELTLGALGLIAAVVGALSGGIAGIRRLSRRTGRP